MAHPRKPSLLQTAGLLTALTVSLSVLSACNPAPFSPGAGTPTAANPGNTGTQKAAEFNTLSGQATLKGAPLANAEIKVFNALNDKAAEAVPTTTANAPEKGKMLVVADSLKTDAQGNFAIKVAGLEPGAVARVVVTANGKTLTGLITGTGATTTSKAYAVKAVTFSLSISEISTILDSLSSGLLAGVSLGGEKGAEALEAFFKSIETDVAPAIQKEADKQGDLLDKLAIDPATGKPKDESKQQAKETLSNLLNTSGAITNFIKAIESTVVALAVNAKAAGVQSDELSKALSGDNLAPVTIKITLSDDGKLTVGDRVVDLTTVPTTPTGQTPSTDPSTRPSTEPSSEPQKDPEVVDLSKPVVSNASAFNPTIAISNDDTVSKVSVSQPAGSDDIAYVVTRMKASDVPAHDWAGAVFGGQVTMGASPKPITLGSVGTAADISLPSRFNFIKLLASNIKLNKKLLVDTAEVATFSVYDQDGYFYLVTKYLLTDSVTINGGHDTWMSVPVSQVKLTKGATVDTVLFSRKGNSVERLDTVK